MLLKLWNLNKISSQKLFLSRQLLLKKQHGLLFIYNKLNEIKKNRFSVVFIYKYSTVSAPGKILN
jgi:hypothetical protein